MMPANRCLHRRTTVPLACREFGSGDKLECNTAHLRGEGIVLYQLKSAPQSISAGPHLITPNQNRKRNLQDPTLVLRLAPAAAVALQKVLRRLRPPASDWVIRKIPRLADLPSLDDGVYQGPRQLYPVLAGKQRRVSFDAVLQQGFVSFGRTTAKGLFVVEIQVERGDSYLRTGGLYFEGKRAALVGLKPHREHVGANTFLGGLFEQE